MKLEVCFNVFYYYLHTSWLISHLRKTLKSVNWVALQIIQLVSKITDNEENSYHPHHKHIPPKLILLSFKLTVMSHGDNLQYGTFLSLTAIQDGERNSVGSHHIHEFPFLKITVHTWTYKTFTLWKMHLLLYFR